MLRNSSTHPVDTAGSVLKVSLLADSAILCESTGPLDPVCQARFWALAQVAGQWHEVEEVVPGMNNLMVVMKRGDFDIEQTAQRLAQEWPHVAPLSAAAKVIDVPVVYGGERGQDLPYVAEHAGLSLEETVSMHAGAEYTVYFLGAHAGFGYLGGMDTRLETPRLEKPRLSVPAGTVAIGGAQTGVIALTGPSGWRLIGAAEVDFFDPVRESPALLNPGDTLRFRCARIES
ncbi:5-oxoprolinase subunit PxpB [Paraburkholderia tropica]|uniref:5-oxoprolinase subunit PxpB n=1 Tax=Paraburkholderia tropica TaxID=92647 RepID=UPI001F2746C4|nr:5-oxoprolinase subunit PxpB [Paraburkholderia tropica]